MLRSSKEEEISFFTFIESLVAEFHASVVLFPALDNFFSHSSCKQAVLKNLLGKLESVSEWMSHQRSYVFYASSLLIVYEGAFRCDQVEVKMIDFAHVFPSFELDSNYIFGLEKFVDCIRVLLNRA